MSRELDAVRQLWQEHGANLAFVVNHSGGKDSTRMLGFVRGQFAESPTYAVMADTGFEHQKPVSAAEFEYRQDGTTGGYLRRFSCRVCIFSTNADLRAIHQRDREAFDLVSNLEAKIGFTMRPGASLVQIVESHVSTLVEPERQQSFNFCL